MASAAASKMRQADGEIIVDDAPEQDVDEVRAVVHPEHEVLHAEEVDGVVVEGRPVAAQDGVLAAPAAGFVADARDVHPGRVRPGEPLEVGDRLGVGEGMMERLAVAVAVALHAEGRPGRRAGIVK